LPNSLQSFQVTLAAIAGLLIGSFLNVCIYRVPRDLSVVKPRSFCPQCEKPIAWYDNIPLLSFLLLRGKCRDCAHRIPLRYPLVETITAAVFAAVVYRYGFTLTALKWVVFESLMIALFCTDLETRILPDEFTLGGSVAGVVSSLFVPVSSTLGGLLLADYSSAWQSLFSMVIGVALITGPIWLAGVLWKKLFKREALGLGDVKLLIMLGVFLGLEGGVLALQIGTISGAVLGLVYVLLTRKNVRTYEVPFGCFLCAAAACVPFLSRMEETIAGR